MHDDTTPDRECCGRRIREQPAGKEDGGSQGVPARGCRPGEVGSTRLDSGTTSLYEVCAADLRARAELAETMYDLVVKERDYERLRVGRLTEERDRLLAALEGLMEWEAEIANDLSLHTNPEPLLAKARAALAKARGEG